MTGPRDEVVRRLLTVVDLRDWPLLGTLVSEDVRYDRPGYPTITGVAELLRFYEHTRMIAGGEHRLDRLLTDETQGFCWGEFTGVSRGGEPLSEVFADWYEFTPDGRVRQRRSFFFRPAI